MKSISYFCLLLFYEPSYCCLFFSSRVRLCACVCLCSCGYTGVMRAWRRILQQGTTPQLDAPHSIWLTHPLCSLFSPLILSHPHFSNPPPPLSSSQVKTDCGGSGTNLTARLFLNEPWHAASVSRQHLRGWKKGRKWKKHKAGLTKRERERENGALTREGSPWKGGRWQKWRYDQRMERKEYCEHAL